MWFNLAIFSFPALSSPPLATGALDRSLALRLEALTPWLFGLVEDSGWSLPASGPYLLMFRSGTAEILQL